jgi:ATP-dependent RNA helicase DeaD
MTEQELTDKPSLPSFEELGLSGPVLKALADVGYETPSPIQAQVVPHLLAGRDVVGQAQTGTGKTGAFAWPLLQQMDLVTNAPQVMVLAPTRELAIQVAEAFERYAKHMPGLNVLPIYGGQSYNLQLRPLKRGVHVVVGTPGRVMDHMRRGSLKLEALKTLVLDEADEMLRMGFIDDVKWILEQLPQGHRTALFSATMPPVIRRIAQEHLTDPAEITIKVKTQTANTITQRFRVVNGNQKLEALARLLEFEEYDGMIVFVRTKIAASQVAERLESRGYASAALSGELAQAQRERVVDRFKAGKLDILVATDVAARGLDLDRISHVINYDIPYDTESYVHRIGRTGRAGRKGQAILFVTPREKRMLRSIERATRAEIEPMQMPSNEDITDMRVARFKETIAAAMNDDNAEFFRNLVREFTESAGVPLEDVAGALAAMAQKDRPLHVDFADMTSYRQTRGSDEARGRSERRDEGRGRDRYEDRGRGGYEDREPRRERKPMPGPSTEQGMERFRIAVGHHHGVRPGQIVGAITGEAGLEGKHVGRIEIYEGFSTVDLPEGMPHEIFEDLRRARVCGQQLDIAKVTGQEREEDFQPSGPRRGGGGHHGPRHGGGFGGHHKGGKRPFNKGGNRPGQKFRRF